MIETYPFHYEVRVKLLAFDKDNNVRNESFTKVFNDRKPLENRANAFDEFTEYLSYIKDRLEKDKYGNYWIKQPFFITTFLDEKKRTEDFFDFQETYYRYKEEISVYLVVDDIDIAKNVIDAFEYNGNVQTEYEIHRVSSSEYDFQPQDLVDNLDMYEMPLYEHFKIDIKNLKTTVYHFGLDYSESGEDIESGAKRTILKTPFVWNTIERYNEIINVNQVTDKDENETIREINWLDIIKTGESNQVEFKPCLLYNFKTKEGGIGIKYIISRTICGFLNSNGGVLFIGVNDDGNIQGLENYDYSLFQGENKKDKILLELDSLLVHFFGLNIKPFVDSSIKKINEKDILIIVVKESPKPIFLRNNKYGNIEKEFFIRMNASTRQIINNEELVEYVFNKQWNQPSR